MLPMRVADNLVLDMYGDPPYAGWASRNLGAVKENAERRLREFDIRARSVDDPVSSLSGGNQQKVVLAREFGRPVKLVVASQPTRGLDVGSIEYVHQRIVAERDQGTAVLIVSSELDEVLALGDRIVVMYRGRIMGVVDPSVGRERIGLMMAGVSRGPRGHSGRRLRGNTCRHRRSGWCGLMSSDTGTVDLEQPDTSAEPGQPGAAVRAGAAFAGHRPAAPARRGERFRRHRMRHICRARLRGDIDPLHLPGRAAGVGAYRERPGARAQRELVDRRRGLLGAVRGFNLQSPRARPYASLQPHLGDARRRHPSHARGARRGPWVFHRSVQYRWPGAADRRCRGRPLGRHRDQGTDRHPHPACDPRRRGRWGRGRVHPGHPQSHHRGPRGHHDHHAQLHHPRPARLAAHRPPVATAGAVERDLEDDADQRLGCLICSAALCGRTFR